MNTALVHAASLEIEPVVTTVADLLRDLGDVSPRRVLMSPIPGMAKDGDLLQLIDGHGREKRLCELIDGVLVEKSMGWYEARLATLLVLFLESYLEEHDIGFTLGADAPHRLSEQLIRLPDVAFVRYESLPSSQERQSPIANWAPDLAVEVLSPSNTSGEMARKLADYFQHGVKRVWYVDPELRTVQVFQSMTDFRTLTEADILDDAMLLPGFQLSIQEWFRRADQAKERGPR
ncbi:Uma2 family endonuclease [bacterium]|nr:Uma2 family endonuclease [bacterium]